MMRLELNNYIMQNIYESNKEGMDDRGDVGELNYSSY